MYERELLSDLPPWWRSFGGSNDPEDGKPRDDYVTPEVREARTKDGNCKHCGKPLPVKSGRGRKPIICSKCRTKDDSIRKQVSRQRNWSTRGKVGSVPTRNRSFVKYCLFINRNVPVKDRIYWMSTDYEGIRVTYQQARSAFTSEWYGPGYDRDDWERGWSTNVDPWTPGFKDWTNEAKDDYYLRPVVSKRGLASREARRAFGKYAEGNPSCNPEHVLNLFTESEALPKGTKPESTFQSHCEECGTQLKEVLARGRDVGGKIGARTIACPKCGLVPDVTPCKSIQSKGASYDWDGSS